MLFLCPGGSRTGAVERVTRSTNATYHRRRRLRRVIFLPPIAHWLWLEGLPGRRSWWWPLGSLSGGVRVVVFVVAADPNLGRVSLVAAERGAVEEAVVSDHEFEPAGGR